MPHAHIAELHGFLHRPSNKDRFEKECLPKQLSTSVYLEEECDYLPTDRLHLMQLQHLLPNPVRRNSLPALLPSFKMDDSAQPVTDSQQAMDTWDSDEEDWFTQDVSKPEQPEPMEPAEPTTSKSGMLI